ncbi:helix-turn-helix domain-containing protein [Klebsiella sp. MISC125]|uniref:helix-turn-helix domain-containing protein n=1 Tax=Klebsiella sp. MISC125 TaxID=2755386 RepID=UPI003DA7EE05
MRNVIFNNMVEWIEARLAINPSVDDIAHGIGCSRRSVYNVFQEYGGLPVGKYIRMRRMTLAAGKLKLTRQSISSIAYLLNYDSHQTFSREFKKTFGLQPREYRASKFWDMTLLFQRIVSERGGLTTPYLCILEEQTFTGYGFNYLLCPTSDISSRKEITRRKVAGRVSCGEENLYILSDFSPSMDNDFKIRVNGFIGAPLTQRNTLFRDVKVVKGGLYLRFDFNGSWSDFTFLSNNVYMKFLPELGLYRREGYDIEHFISQKGALFENEWPVYTLQYYVPVEYISLAPSI